MKPPKKPKTLQQQYEQTKAVHPDMLLLFRFGDFYEFFAEDAETAARVLGLTLTWRQELRMCGFPHHQREAYLQKLLKEGHKVAICEQVQD
jgi:DNA mismatch repair protein MutS